MASPSCLRCLKRSLRSIDPVVKIEASPRAAFSTTAYLSASPPKKKPAAGARQGRTLRLSKNVRSSAARPPAPGERKALRKRIVLSNTNAIEIEGLQDLTGDKLARHEADTVALAQYRGQVLGLTNETVDALRALEAFKATQGWSLFRRPASLVRAETAELANDLANAEEESKEVVRKVVYGPKRGGKSVLLLQAQAMAFVKGWLVFHFPEAQDLTNAHTAYQPINTPDGTIYIQPHYTAKLLANLASANQTLLSRLRLSKQHQLPIPIQPNISLARFAELGARDVELAWPIWQALWSELTAPSKPETEGLARPPVLVSMDGVDQAMRLSAYLDRDADPVHAHDLALTRHFMHMLSGKTELPNGGMVLAATCESNRAASPTLDFCLQQNLARQLESKDDPHWNSYALKDKRVEDAMKMARPVELQGLSKEEARGVMEYYAQSGMLRSTVTDGLVSEKWTMAGAGIIGELEKAAVLARF
ncbi:hypothetical protein LTR37_017603 [Vermiconidia calcicola]|uniref:Uncharacterized protein n=1 Tax=Vermiconidia calcicola TaxID=1690605 RepID=A0ACC3MJK4_9PEZI|nr:hypothetical protein LTR37_017603 [Vermiconidia calcicola]